MRERGRERERGRIDYRPQWKKDGREREMRKRKSEGPRTRR